MRATDLFTRPLRPAVRTTLVLLAAVLLLPTSWLGQHPVAAGTGDGDVTIEVLGTRADLVSAGDALVQLTLPTGIDPAEVVVTAGTTDVSSAFDLRSDGRVLGLVQNLPLGDVRLTATLPDGSGATLDLTNHPKGGPIFSGPQVEPWTCSEGAEDAQCNRPPTYEFLYQSTDGGGLQSYDPDSPPDDVAETTTDEGMTVPFIVRVETGTIVRDEYKIAVLFDPAQPWEPTEPQPQWNRKLLITHGASCDVTFEAGSAPSVTSDGVAGNSPTVALGRGFAVMSHALDNAGHNCNNVTQAEALLATKEHLVDTYGGPIRYTIGTGCSGGSLTQQHVANSYPGIYQGILPQCSFTDSWSSTMQYQDYVLTRRYFEDPSLWAPGTVWGPPQIEAVNGHPNLTNPITFTEVIAPTRDPSRDCPGLADELVYHHEDNVTGIRCSIMDYMVNSVGRRTSDAWTDNEVLRGEGHARSPYDNTGIQYGLAGLRSGILPVANFIDINVKVGAKDIDYEQQEARRAADPRAVELSMRTGAVNVGNNMADVAIIDLRGPDPGAFHDVYRTYAMRERLLREQGHADNQVLWRGSVALVGDPNFTTDALLVMDEWLAAIEADDRDVPLPQKIVEDKPESAGPRCTDGNGTDVAAEFCDAAVESYSTPRIEAGMPLTDDILKCALQPLESFDYGDVTFTDAQMSTLREVFPDGVCDYTQQGVEWTPTVPWLDYTAVVGGTPMGAAPVSVPFSAEEGPAAQVLRVAGGDRISTAIALSMRGFADGAAAAILARADDFPDALAAVSLAAAVDGPVLLTGSQALDDRVAGELERLGAQTVYLVGGETALSDQVANAVAAVVGRVERLAGPDRFATAAAIADAVVAEGGPAAGAVLALGQAETGRDAWPDALSASNLAGTGGGPVLLTGAEEVPAATIAALDRLGIDAVTLVGGTAAIRDGVADHLAQLGIATDRVAGPDRFGTATALATAARQAGADGRTVILATGAAFPDALGAGAAAVALDGPLLLTAADQLPAAVAAWLETNAEGIDTVLVAGGPAAVHDNVLGQVEAIIAPV